MAARTWTLYNNDRKKLVNGTMDLNAGVWRMKMYKGQAAASVSLSTLSTLTQLGTSNAAANMSSYPLVTFTFTAIAGSATHKYTAANIVCTASGGDAASVQYARPSGDW